MKQRIIDSTSGDPITGRIGRFTATTYRRGEAGVQTVFEGVHAAAVVGRGKRELTAVLTDAAEQRVVALRRRDARVVALPHRGVTTP